MTHKRPSEILIKDAVPAAKPARPDKQLAWLLRRGAEVFGLEMDDAGWVRIEDLRRVGMSKSRLESALTAGSPKERAMFEVADGCVRAHEGHWPRALPVTLEALEASWDPFIPDGPLWYGTNQTKLRRIAAHGVTPGHRSHVRLETSADSKQLNRSDVLLEVSPRRLFGSGLNVYRARNGTVLVRRIPPSAILRSVPTPRNKRHFEADLQALLEG